MHYLYRLLSKSINITLHRIIILPLALFGRENLSPTFSEQHRLKVRAGGWGRRLDLGVGGGGRCNRRLEVVACEGASRFLFVII